MSLRKSLSLLLATLCAVVPEILSQSTAPNPGGNQPRFRADVDQVVLYAAVYDRKGQLVRGLSRNDFRVFEDAVPQEITYFGADEGAATVGLVIDVSGSMLYTLAKVKRAARDFVEEQDPRTESFLIVFNQDVRLRKGFTRKFDEITGALEDLEARGGTALYDAIYLGVENAEKGTESKKILLVFTDGVDKDSIYQFPELRERIRRSEVQVHFVAFLQEEKRGIEFEDDFKRRREEVVSQLREIAAQSGGRAFFAEQEGELKTAFQSIARDARHQYRLAYISSNRRQDGTWRNIEVELTDATERGRRVRARRGYFAKSGVGEGKSVE